MDMIRENIQTVQENIRAAALRAGRDPSEITLIAVSKTMPVEKLMEAYDAGIRDFGENKVQELCQKIDTLPKDIRWHMIGHLQRNKVKYLADRPLACIHSVDSYRLAEAINIQAKKQRRRIPVLVEVNIAHEDSKFGIHEDTAIQLVKDIATLDGLRVRGLMTIAPMVSDPEENRLYFRKIKRLSVDIAAQNIDNVSMDILSMGMTGDYVVAVEEGATHVRVGTGIFGARNYAVSQAASNETDHSTAEV